MVLLVTRGYLKICCGNDDLATVSDHGLVDDTKIPPSFTASFLMFNTIGSIYTLGLN
jgi:hypothetical protein